MFRSFCRFFFKHGNKTNLVNAEKQTMYWPPPLAMADISRQVVRQSQGVFHVVRARQVEQHNCVNSCRGLLIKASLIVESEKELQGAWDGHASPFIVNALLFRWLCEARCYLEVYSLLLVCNIIQQIRFERRLQPKLLAMLTTVPSKINYPQIQIYREKSNA